MTDEQAQQAIRDVLSELRQIRQVAESRADKLMDEMAKVNVTLKSIMQSVEIMENQGKTTP